MSSLCRHGLFIGVDRYAKLAKSKWLLRASSDARLLYEYFSRADPKGVWKMMPKGKQPPKRIEILAAIDDLANRVPSNEAGFFCFSGHAALSVSGLVLKTFDTHDRFLSDTGLPLARVFEILKRHHANGKRFFVALDCCRDGARESAVDDLPPNVTVLYACGQSTSAFETDRGGLLTRSITETLETSAFQMGVSRISIRAVCRRLGRQTFAWRPAAALAHEVYGSAGDEIELPCIACKRPISPNSDPASSLVYTFGSRAEFETAVLTLAKSIFDWYAISPQSRPGQQFVMEHFHFPDGSRFDTGLLGRLAREKYRVLKAQDASDTQPFGFEIELRDGASRWSASEFLRHVVEVPVDSPQTLTLRWNDKVEFAIFKQFEHVVEGEWIGGDRLSWQHDSVAGRFRGVASVSDEGSSTSVYLTCETLDCYESSLRYLMPSLQDVYNLFRYVRI